MSEHAVVSIAVGDTYSRIIDITAPLMSDYARRIGADLHIIRDRRPGEPPHFTKFRLYELLERYRRVLFIDADALVLPHAPDAFAEVAEDAVGATIVSNHTARFDNALSWIEELLRPVGVGRVCWNSGVFLVSRRHRDLFRTDVDEFRTWLRRREAAPFYVWFDQIYLNYRAKQLGFRLHDMGWRWNHTRVFGRSAKRFRSYIIHYAGRGHRRGGRVRQICRDARVIRRPRALALLAKHPRLTWLGDRV